MGLKCMYIKHFMFYIELKRKGDILEKYCIKWSSKIEYI